MVQGNTILIGRDPNTGKLAIALPDGNGYKAAIINVTVPRDVSRFRPELNTGHCRLVFGANGEITIVNESKTGNTFVGGVPVLQKTISADSKVTLGQSQFALDMPQIMATVKTLAGRKETKQENAANQAAPEYSIAHLEHVWNNYKASVDRIRKEQREKARRGRLPSILTMGSGAVGTFLSLVFKAPEVVSIITGVLFGTGILWMLYNYYEAGKDTTAEELDKLRDDLIDKYACPNPACRHFMGEQPWKVVRQNKKCPWCGCRYRL